MRSLQGRRASSVFSLIKDAQILTQSMSPTRTRQWNEPWRELSVEMFELWRGQEGDVCVCACMCVCSSAEVFSVKMRCLYQPSPLLLQASACVTLIVFASHAKYLLFPSTFCRQALVPQLLFVSVQEMRVEKRKKKGKTKRCACHLQLLRHCPPHLLAPAHLLTFSQNCGGWGVEQSSRTQLLIRHKVIQEDPVLIQR